MDLATQKLLTDSIKSIVDYPKAGIVFRDITSLIENAEAFAKSIELLAEHYRNKGITKVVGTEARGFIFGAPVAAAIGAGFVPARKPGKLPRATVVQVYDLEYGTDMLQIHKDAIEAGDKVVVIDDLLATGGTLEATIKLIKELKGEVVGAGVVIELPDLKGKAKLDAQQVELFSLIQFEGE